MYKLRTKITLSYVAISLVIVALISIVANVTLEKQFRKYVIKTQQQKSAEIIRQISERYNSFNHNWSYDVLDSIGVNALENSLIIRVKNAEGLYLWNAWEHNNGMCTILLQNIAENMYSRYPNFNGRYVEESYDIFVKDEKVGSVDIGYYGPFYFNDNGLNFINTCNCLLIGVGIFSFVIAIILGLLTSHRLTMPISKVINVAGQIAKGDFSQRVLIKSSTKEIRELMLTINNLAETLETEGELRKRLTSDVAHELRTPLSTLQSHMEAMIDGIWEPDKERLQGCHDEIMRLSRMTSDLQRLANLESENLILNKTAFSMAELINRTVLNFEAEFAKKEIQLIVNNHFTGEVFADRDKLNQIIINILSNALKYTKPGGNVHITLEETDGAVFSLPGKTRLTADRMLHSLSGISITVKDSGIGIAKEDLPFIFERFYRTDKSRNKSTGGIGIGLTIVKSLVLAHGGDISVESELGQSTTFTIYLPLEKPI